jgi:restriction system protein
VAADTSAERVGVLMDSLMRLLADHPDGLKAKDALSQLRERVQLTPYELGTYADGSSRFDKVVRFSTIDLKQAGWMTKERGFWFITPEGTAALSEHPDPVDRYRRARALYAEWRRSSSATSSESRSEMIEVDEADPVAALEAAEADAWDQVRTYLKKIHPYSLQDLVAALLEGMGYHVAWSAPPGKDGGVDVIAYSDPLGTSGPRIKVQVKRWESRAPVDEVRSFISLLGQHDIGLFVCTGGFTKDAEEHARNQENRRVTLMDADALFQLWIEYYDRVPQQSRALLPIRPIYFLDHIVLT